MEAERTTLGRRLKRAIARRSFWIIVAMLAAITMLHYSLPSARLAAPWMDGFLSRHAVERIIFILPVAGAAFTYGQVGGMITLALVILIMLPRVLWISPYPLDAGIEIAAVAVVGYLVVWMIETQEREKRLRQQTLLRLRALNAVATIITHSPELEQILNGALEKVLEVTGLEAGLIFLLEPQRQELVLAAHRGMSPETIARLERMPVDENVYGRAMRSGQPVVVDEPLAELGRAGEAVWQEGLHSQMVTPLKSKGKVQGVLAVAARRGRAFSAEDLELVDVIGNQIGVAVENASLHRDIARQLHIQRWLNEVAERITSELELEKLLPKVLQIAEEMVGAEAGAIALLDPQSQCIQYPYLHNLPAELAEITLSIHEGLAGEVVRSARPVLIDDYRSYPAALPAFAATGLTSVAAVPIVSGSQVFGILAVGSLDSAKRFSEQDVAVLVAMGRQTGVAVENAHLYESMRFYARQIIQAQENERKRIAQELHDETVQMLIAISRRLEGLLAVQAQLSEPAPRDLEQARELTRNAIAGIRRFVQDLRPPALDHLGLVAALEGLADDMTAREGIRAELVVEGVPQRPAPEAEMALFRIAQEALNNVRRHANASRALIRLTFHPGAVQMTISDDGCGFAAPQRIGDLATTGRLGLIGMYERARTLGGELSIQAEPGRGTTVTARLPVQPERSG